MDIGLDYETQTPHVLADGCGSEPLIRWDGRSPFPETFWSYVFKEISPTPLSYSGVFYWSTIFDVA